MTTRTRDGTDRLPTTGPEPPPTDGIEAVTTDDGAVMLYDTDDADRWIESDEVYALADWQ